MIPPEWTPHHRPDDRELLGWIRPEESGYVPVSRLGRDLSGPVEWLVLPFPAPDELRRG